ncbi:Acyl-CoA carboxylase epsilon subunit [Kytococcus aerolatus]|uniref:Acyl-CoA carboxylase epsilon subunit n=1 Tax=Kytococcus aerolatus TaxID=592308 RepID=A0A212TZJ8_9MICO|nr:acyl-CoA carboxylase epsilon subunit [Kytococcus aerolatus]SNC71422.1 Acyl-CoA carboxylase epsilon subunit [Kytococcus aerolatus]
MSGEQQDPATGSEQGEAPEELAGGATTPEDPAGEALVSVRGAASAEELAALTAVFTAVGGGGGSAPAVAPAGRWGDPAASARRTPQAGPGAWRASGLPR